MSQVAQVCGLVRVHAAIRFGDAVWNVVVFFDPAKYDRQEEVLHTQGMAWGRTDYGKELNEFKMRMYRCVLGRLYDYCAPPATLLDVGCAYGGFLTEAREAGYRVSGLDIVPEAVE